MTDTFELQRPSPPRRSSPAPAPRPLARVLLRVLLPAGLVLPGRRSGNATNFALQRSCRRSSKGKRVSSRRSAASVVPGARESRLFYQSRVDAVVWSRTSTIE